MFKQPNQEIAPSLRPEIDRVFAVPSNPEVVVPIEDLPIGQARSDVDRIYMSSSEVLRTPEQIRFAEIALLSMKLEAALAYRLDSQFVRTPQNDFDLAA